MKLTLLKRLALACAIGSFTTMASASVVIAGTRVIYPAAEREVTVKLTNDGKEPALVQTWIDDGDDSTAAQKRTMPFTLTPPVFRLDPNKGQTLRVTYTHEPLAADHESVYYLNVLEIPPRANADDKRNMLQMAFRSRIKLFFRPAGLEGDANDAPAKVTWSLDKSADGKHVAVLAKNPTPYHVNVAGVSVQVGDKKFEAAPGMIDPRGQREYVLQDLRTLPAGQARITFETINDFGANVPGVYPPEPH